MDSICHECEALTGNRCFMYLASLFKPGLSNKVYTVHSFIARRLMGDKVYSRRDEEDDFWAVVGLQDDSLFKLYHTIAIYALEVTEETIYTNQRMSRNYSAAWFY